MSDCRSNCPIPNGGLCERHSVQKSITLARLCVNKIRYWQAWEKGVGPGQIAMRHRVQTPAYNSHIGDILSRRFEAIGIKPIPGCPCKDLQNRLNSMTPEQVLSDLAGLTVKLRNSAKRWKELKGGAWNFVPAPPLWLCKRVLEDAVNEARGIIAAEQLTDIAIPG